MSYDRDPSGWAIGWTAFAGFMMILGGGWWILSGFIAIVNDDFYTETREYVFDFNASTWGWVHLILGVVILLAGVGLFSGRVWARMVGVIIAGISALVAFTWLPWYPIFGITFIAIAISVIWALTAHGRDITVL